MVIAMAMTKHGYDPAKRNTAAKDIADEIRERGMQLSDDTVRDFLKKAADEELPKQQGDEQSA
jgi:repressor of nif and glnA expression